MVVSPPPAIPSCRPSRPIVLLVCVALVSLASFLYVQEAAFDYYDYFSLSQPPSSAPDVEQLPPSVRADLAAAEHARAVFRRFCAPLLFPWDVAPSLVHWDGYVNDATVHSEADLAPGGLLAQLPASFVDASSGRRRHPVVRLRVHHSKPQLSELLCSFVLSGVRQLRAPHFVLVTAGKMEEGSPFDWGSALREHTNGRCNGTTIAAFLDHPKLLAWFVTQHGTPRQSGRNEMLWPPLQHPKLQLLPLGMFADKVAATRSTLCSLLRERLRFHRDTPAQISIPPLAAGNRSMEPSWSSPAISSSSASPVYDRWVYLNFNPGAEHGNSLGAERTAVLRTLAPVMVRDRLVWAPEDFSGPAAREFRLFSHSRRPTTPPTLDPPIPPPVPYNWYFGGLSDELYFEQLSRSRFSASPAGTGFDCYRHWESLAFGSMPVIVRAFPQFDAFWTALPVLLVDSYSDVNGTSLRAAWEAYFLSATTADTERDQHLRLVQHIDLAHWNRQILLTAAVAET
jgi:hypothetical protein